MPPLLRFFDHFLPDSLRTNPQDLMRGYILVGITFTNLLICLITAAGLLFLVELEHNVPIALALDSACVLGYAACLWLLKKTESYELCSHFILTILLTVIVCGVQITGGYLKSPILQLVLQVPVMAFLLLGPRAGLGWLAGTLAICLASYLGAVYDAGQVQLLQSEDIRQAMYILLQFVLILIIGSVLMVYETLNGLLKKELQAERSKLEHLASHDDLTGIANRFEFFRRLQSHIEEARGRSQTVGVVYIDLDDFKPVNDTHGHHMGDETLRAVAERLQRVLRLADTTARLGGDEFALILPGIRVPDDIDTIMPKVLAAIREPIELDGVQVKVRGSCGVAVYPMHSRDHNDLCRFADAAMYAAKNADDAYLLYNNQMTLRSP